MAPQRYARTGGFLYLFIIVAALFGEAFVRGRLIVDGDAAATASNILGAETLFRVGLAGELLTCACDVALAMILYVLLEPVNRPMAMLAAFFRLTFVAVYAVAKPPCPAVRAARVYSNPCRCARGTPSIAT